MSKIAYDPVKDKFSDIIKGSRFLRRVFYALLDLFFLRSWHIRRLIKKHGHQFEKKKKWNLLDAGSGFGQYDRFILKSFNNVFVDAVDVKQEYLDESIRFFEKEIEKKRIRFRTEDLLEFKTEKKYDLVICVDVLEHIENDVKVIKNMSSVMNEGGIFIMHSPSHYSEEDADGDDSFVGEHARAGYSKQEITNKLEKSGLKPVNVHYTYGFWGHKAWILSVKWPMLWFNRFGLSASLLLLFYYPLAMPFCLIMNFSDLYSSNRKGNGVYAVGEKV